MTRRPSEIMSIFGQIEEVVAEQMIGEGTGVGRLAPTLNIGLDDIPPSTRFNEHGEPVRLVIIMPSHLKNDFERRVKNLRA